MELAIASNLIVLDTVARFIVGLTLTQCLACFERLYTRFSGVDPLCVRGAATATHFTFRAWRLHNLGWEYTLEADRIGTESTLGSLRKVLVGCVELADARHAIEFETKTVGA